MSCADAPPGGNAAERQPAAAAALQHQQSGPQGSGVELAGMLPDPLMLAGDESGVYIGMSRLLAAVAASGACCAVGGASGDLPRRAMALPGPASAQPDSPLSGPPSPRLLQAVSPGQ